MCKKGLTEVIVYSICILGGLDMSNILLKCIEEAIIDKEYINAIILLYVCIQCIIILVIIPMIKIIRHKMVERHKTEMISVWQNNNEDEQQACNAILYMSTNTK